MKKNRKQGQCATNVVEFASPENIRTAFKKKKERRERERTLMKKDESWSGNRAGRSITGL